MWIFYFYLDRYSHAFKVWLCKLHEGLFNYIDKPPKKKKNEKISNYALRIDKRHALRVLKRALLVTRVFNIEGLDSKLGKNPSAGRREMFKIMRSQTESYYLYKYLTEQISNSYNNL